ncbi:MULTISPECIES: MotA/TolQ/ExbB proton channel family protein [Methanohalophilus]|jgi:biopolymer transport protein ExbB/TolQ|uniref:Biopolymer transport protein ExbB/TolQ n=1 Tax=Methanohalophilus euhalobius TaxID=51203 RepID=A0A314ZXS1_9EURY|nr:MULTISPECIES: MotA/TolQ/ExbB proton channel family protein [Methanohalophilus]OBZ35308.1 MAG: flagellar motor protein MotA [Methanohalophilus sp. DAL1]PQV43423.1 biopolymer transport protein ExbB/TolQ [Methanohalophilus euhalobius]RNI07410.1 MotA/TolQ/ExbB proton channel family protein [Methanohalophilus euhalobius]RSD33395.1 MAG: MotA/TolQ/ExbB proton channel [Methanohalophilus sp.]
MAIDSSLFQIMYTVSSSLLYPVIILLLLAVVSSLALIGEFISEYSKRHRNVTQLEDVGKRVQDSVKSSDFDSAASHLGELKQNSLVMSFARDAAAHLGSSAATSIDWLSEEYEVRMTKNLEYTKILSTVSPMLGLMGTLIPLGPALIGLAEGNILQLAHNLMVAFATTVLGLFAGIVGYVLTVVRKRWYWQDMADINYLLDCMEDEA